MFITSFLVYACLNTLENFIHYNIGRNKDRHTYKFKFTAPSIHDIVKMISVMLLFASLQALFTSALMLY